MEPSSPVIRVIVADDEPDLVEYLQILLDLEGFEVVGSASDAQGAVRLADDLHPDVALLDLRMPGGGLEAARLIGSLSPNTRIVMFSGQAETPEILPLLQAGIDGYVVKGSPSERLGEAIRSAVHGGAYLAPAVNKVAIDQLNLRLHREEARRSRRTRAHERIADIIEQNRFESVHQPIIDLRTGAAQGVEALTRFTASPTQSPQSWFADAERVGMRQSLELVTARTALRCLDQLHPRLYMTVNISPTTALSGRLGEVLLGVDLERVVLELTEHSRVRDYAALTAALAPWRHAGARLAVDDAGGGYASFAHILSLSPEFIKLDISLVRDIDVDRQRQALARAISGFAAELGVSVIAEGVETAAELEVIANLGTPLAQGFHLGRPRRLEDQVDLLGDDAAIDLRTEPAQPVDHRPA